MILGARRIAVCEKAFDSLSVQMVRFRGFTENGLESVVESFVERTDYDNYIIASDDLVPTQGALDVVEEGLEDCPVFTGWCNISPTNGRANVRLWKPLGRDVYFQLCSRIAPLRRLTDWAKLRTFPLPSQLPDGRFQVASMGFAFSGMRRRFWQTFPFLAARSMVTGRSFGSDYVLSRRLSDSCVPMYCDKRAFFYHLHSMENFEVGKVVPTVEELMEVVAV